jgi:hypothetical protein
MAQIFLDNDILKTITHKIFSYTLFQKIVNGLLLLICVQLFLYALACLFMLINWLF